MTEGRKEPAADAPGAAGSSPPKPGSAPPRLAVDVMLGSVLNGKYRIVDVLATGGMGRIYSAEQLPLGRMVAVKVLLPAFTDAYAAPSGADSIRRRFLREASVLAKLQHPNIVTVFDYGRIETPPSDRERFFMAMELLQGETLQERLDRDGHLTEAQTIGFLRQMGRGLRAAHALGVVHRDLKPSNLMIIPGAENESALKLLDFGVTKVMDEKNQDLTDEGIVVGSPRFMSPEQVGGAVDARTDIYSLGIIAFTMLTGAPPFLGNTAMMTMMAHLNTPLPSLAGGLLGVSEPLDAFIQRCCEKDPADRFQTADALLEALNSSFEGGTSGRMSTGNHSAGRTPLPPVVPVRVEALPAGTTGDPAVTPPRSRRTVVIATLAAAVAALIFFSFGLSPKPVPATASTAPVTTSPSALPSPPAPDVDPPPSSAPAPAVDLAPSPPAGSRHSSPVLHSGRKIPTPPPPSAPSSSPGPIVASPTSPPPPPPKVDPFEERK